MGTKLSVLILLFAVSACNQGKPEHTDTKVQLKRKASSMADMRTGYTSDNYKNVLVNYTFDPVNYLEVNKYMQDKGLLPSTHFNAGLTWQEVDEAAKKVLSEKANDPNEGVYKQYCAVSVLTNTDLLSATSPEAQKVVAFYLDILFKEKNESIGLYYYALRNASPILSKEYIKEVSDFAIASAKKSLVGIKETLANLSLQAKKEQNTSEKDRIASSIEIGKYIVESDETFIEKIASLNT
ncbi:hypothetical protein [Dyadobacter sp. OTU695]|uniref:hypothetical protein n=1 Tax=Dyadobacter sp. OTU695 TaxID=3043860 RepID=UPI00313C6CBB